MGSHGDGVSHTGRFCHYNKKITAGARASGFFLFCFLGHIARSVWLYPRRREHIYLLPHRESADKVVLHTGKYEELIVCSHEIAASTAQLVAASKVIV